LISKSISSLVLILPLSSWFFIGLCIFLITFLSITHNCCSSMSFRAQVSHPYVTTGLIRLL
jgi:hypothetical protein